MKHMLKAPTRFDSFEEGEYVLVEQGSSFRRGPDDKLLPFLAGPYVVIGVKGSEYTLRNCITQKTKTVQLSNLTAYRVEEYHRTPAEAALRDFKDIFMVDKIVSGESDNDLKGPVSALKFRVSWLGFPGEDTVEQWKDIRNLEQLRTFLVEHSDRGYRGLTRKLPKGNRVENDNEDSNEVKPTEGRSSKTGKPKKERKEKKQKPILEEAEEVKDIQGVDELNEQPIVESTVESSITYKKPKTKMWKSFNQRRSSRVKTRSIRLTRDEREGVEEV
jgi:hypothetical protein